MWVNPFPRRETNSQSLEAMSFREAQAYVNFVILEPQTLPIGTERSEITVRKETPAVRSSIRFEIAGANRSFRVKQFFYDWSIPGIYADTNLVGQGEPFVVDSIVGFFGTDYKGNAAACYAKWFTQVEVSVLRGTFEKEELLSFFAGLTPSVKEAVPEVGEQPFASTSHTARFHVPRWSETDPVNRVHWDRADDVAGKHLPEISLPIPMNLFSYTLDSVGSFTHHDGVEYQLLLRDSRNQTDCIWIWRAPDSLRSPFPEVIGQQVGNVQNGTLRRRGRQSRRSSCAGRQQPLPPGSCTGGSLPTTIMCLSGRMTNWQRSRFWRWLLKSVRYDKRRVPP